MGKSYWPFLVRSQEDVDRVKRIVAVHNARQDVGEALEPAYLVRYQGHFFWLQMVSQSRGASPLYPGCDWLADPSVPRTPEGRG